jgi:MOSC domain-containing protein YiiM
VPADTPVPSPIVLSIQVGMPRLVSAEEAPDPRGRSWRTGFFKRPVAGPVWLGRTNLAGDGQADLKNHGGPDKAVLCYSAEYYPHWRAELEMPDLPFGAFAENFTVTVLDEERVCLGDIYEVGEALVQVTQPRQPCWEISARWRRPDLTERVLRTGRTGWYLRVLREGMVEAGVPMLLRERPYAEWTVARATATMRASSDIEGARALLGVAALSDAWRATLTRRTQRAKT